MAIWKKEVTLEELNATCKNSLISYLNIEFTEIGNDYLAATMPVNDTTKQPFGILHGGASCALAETVATAAANLCLKNDNKLCVGLDLNLNHIRAVKNDPFILSVAKPLHVGKVTHVWEIKNYNSNNNVISVGRITIMVIDKQVIS